MIWSTDTEALRCITVYVWSISTLRIRDVAFYHCVPQFACLSALSVPICFFILPSWQSVSRAFHWPRMFNLVAGDDILQGGVSFPSFLDFMEYNFLIDRLEIGEFGPVGKRARAINEASKTPAAVCCPPILPRTCWTSPSRQQPVTEIWLVCCEGCWRVWADVMNIIRISGCPGPAVICKWSWWGFWPKVSPILSPTEPAREQSENGSLSSMWKRRNIAECCVALACRDALKCVTIKYNNENSISVLLPPLAHIVTVCGTHTESRPPSLLNVHVGPLRSLTDRVHGRVLAPTACRRTTAASTSSLLLVFDTRLVQAALHQRCVRWQR